MTAPIRFGLIGYGAWGSHHARAISEVPEAHLIAISSGSEASGRRAGAEHPAARVYTDYQAMLAREPLDAVCVVVPSHLHYKVASEALLSERHVLLEKPMALTVDHCDRLIELAQSRRRLIAVGHELRLSSLWGNVKRLVDAGTIGEPLHALVELWRHPYRLGSGGWRYDIHRVGNWVLEEPIHFFDLARWYFAAIGEPVQVFAAGIGRRPDRPELHDNFSALLTFANGQYALISQTLDGWEHHQSVKLTGTEGAIWARWQGAMDRTFEPTFSLQVREADRVAELPIAEPAGEVFELVEQLRAFVRSIQRGAESPCTGEDGKWAVAMCVAAQRSLETKQSVKIGQR